MTHFGLDFHSRFDGRVGDSGVSVKKFNPHHDRLGRFSSGAAGAPNMDMGAGSGGVDRAREGFKEIMKPYLERMATHGSLGDGSERGGPLRDISEMHVEIEAGGKVRDEIDRRRNAIITSPQFIEREKKLIADQETAYAALMMPRTVTELAGAQQSVDAKTIAYDKHYGAATAFNTAYNDSPVRERLQRERETLRAERFEIHKQLEPIRQKLNDEFSAANPDWTPASGLARLVYVNSGMPKDLVDKQDKYDARLEEIGRFGKEAQNVGLTHAAVYGRGGSDTPRKKMVLSADNPFRSDSNYMEKLDTHIAARDAYRKTKKEMEGTVFQGRSDRMGEYNKAVQALNDFRGTAGRRNIIKEVLEDVGVQFSEGKVLVASDPTPNGIELARRGDALITRSTKRSKAVISLENVAPYLPKKWVASSNAAHPIRIEWNTKRRGVYLGGGKIVTAANNTTLHEMIHNAEATVPQLLPRQREFHAYRTQGSDSQKLQKLEPGRRFRSYEVSNPDKFYDSYCGKTYGGRNYELMTMGYADLMFRTGNKNIDPEYEAWVYSVIMRTS
jgi:hypothetical protein